NFIWLNCIVSVVFKSMAFLIPQEMVDLCYGHKNIFSNVSSTSYTCFASKWLLSADEAFQICTWILIIYNWPLRYAVLQEISQERINCYIVAYLLQNGLVMKIISMDEKVGEASTNVLHTHQGEIAKAEDLFQEMIAKGMKPDIVLHWVVKENKMMHNAGEVGKWTQILVNSPGVLCGRQKRTLVFGELILHVIDGKYSANPKKFILAHQSLYKLAKQLDKIMT
ncbi:hypothetical protein ACJX0J_017028, partial [Zea mays]